MNKKLLILVIISIILIIILITMGIFSFFNQNKAKVVETKTFSEIPGFSFEYPVFKGWEVGLVKKINENEYQIFFNCPFETVVAPSMKIVKDYRMEKRTANSLLENKNKVSYAHGTSSSGEVVSFDGPYYIVDIYPFTHEGDGFSGKVLTKKIIETFKFTNCSPETIGAVPLKKLVKVGIPSISYKDVLISKGAQATIGELEEIKENPEDFYTTVEVVEKSGLNGYLITYHLSHKDDFKPENCNKPGNPSGKSRDMVCDTNQNKIISDLLWK